MIAHYKDNKWGEVAAEEPYVKLHVLANVFHYGQAVFEGLKAFHHKDGTVALFNPKENAKRLQRSGQRMGMPDLPESLFLEACEKVVKENIDHLPPYGTGGSLYLRPFYFGAGSQLGLGRAKEYIFGVISSPVGLYYPSGLKPVDALVIEHYDRAAPKGVGGQKTAGNYAADIVPAAEAAAQGYPIALYLDAKERKYIEEFSTSNFVGITKDKSTYVTPDSPSVLRSNTNIMLRELAKEKGLKVEVRPITLEEVESGGLSEAAACGTAVIVTPIRSITHKGKKTQISEKLDILEDLYNEIRAIQTGEMEDKHGWNYVVGKK